MKAKIIILTLLGLFLTLNVTVYCQSRNTNLCVPGDVHPKDSIPPELDLYPTDSTLIPVELSKDPNEIVGTRGYDALGDSLQWVSATTMMPYTVYFENDPDLATAAAQKVVVRYGLPYKADISTFAISAFGFGSHVFTVEENLASYQRRLDLTQDMGIYVDVSAGIDIMAGEAVWILQSIDPATGLPPQGTQQGFLPVNDSTQRGEGFVNFTIKPNSRRCITGDTIMAQASIVFDVNEPIPTNIWHNTVDALPPTTQLVGTEGRDNEIVLQFSGQDDEGGCGIKQYKLYVSDNFGAYSLYGTYPVGSEATYPTEYDHCYRFFCLGEDNVGNVEAMKEQAEVEYGNYNLMVSVAASPEKGGTVTGEGLYTYNSQVTVTAVPAMGYEFYRWTRNGVPVSEEPTYTFSIVEEMNLVAQFVEIASVAQTCNLAEGWNWWSTNIELNGMDGLTMLENSLGSNGMRIQSKGNGYVDQFEYNGEAFWYGTLNAIVNEQMYLVRTNAACNVTMTGIRALSANHPITISSGWNWIGFLGNESVSVSTALNSFTPEADDQIKSKNSGFATYFVYGSDALWYGTLNTLEPGQGYMYKSNSSENKTLVYQNGREETLVSNITTEGNAYLPKESDFAYNMTITAVVDLEGSELRSEAYELAAFVGDECRGSVKLMYVEPIDRYVAFLLVSGEQEESLNFVLTDSESVHWSDDHLTFAINGIVGTLAEPTVLHFSSMAVDENEQDLVSVYPNPSKGIFNIEGKGIRRIEVVNAYGQVVYMKETKDNYLQLDLGAHAAGVYLLRVVTDKGITTQEIIKK